MQPLIINCSHCFTSTDLQAYRSNQKEAKSWLLNAIASLDIQDPGIKRRKFAQFLPGGSLFDKGQHEEFGRQLLLGLSADEPRKVGAAGRRHPSTSYLVAGGGGSHMP